MADRIAHEGRFQIIRVLSVDLDHPKHMEYFEQHDHGRGPRHTGRQAASHRIVNPTAVKGFEDFLGGPGLIRSFLLCAADGEGRDSTGCRVRAPAAICLFPGPNATASTLPDSG